ncbi:MAG: type II toxin-antitoxin system YafQ family toxin [Caulobacteraceae bacterium]
MREIERTTQFRRDYKREARGKHRATLESGLAAVLLPLMQDLAPAERFRDHPLAGEWAGLRDCHVKPDLVLIYEKAGATILRLVRLGSHSELGL